MAKLYNMAQMSVAVPPGTGPFTLSAAAVAEGVTYLTLAQAGAVNGDLASYRAYDGPQWEVGRGTVGGGGTILTRGPLKSSIGGGPINASAGTFVLIAPLGEDFSDLDAAIALKENTITPGTSAQYWSGDKSWRLLDKMAVGLSTVDNTSDLNKPVSTATQTALDLKASLDSPVFVGNPTAPTPSPGDSDTSLATTGFVAAALAAVGAGGTVAWDDVTGKPSTYPPTLPIAQSGVTNLIADLAAKEATIAAGTTAQYWRGDKAWQTLDKTAVGLSNVDNTSDANKPVSTATQTALNLKENTANKGVANGYASLDAGAKIPAVQLPSYVDDVQEFANLAAFPATGTTGIIYVAIDTNKTYRWSGTGYVEISPSPGSTDSLPEGSVNLYYTNVRASAAAPVQSVATRTGAVVLTKTDVGLANVDNTSDLNKPISTATQTALNGKEATIAAGLTTQYWRGDKSWQILDKTAVGLANVDNTSDVNKPISTATQTALNGKEPTIAGGTTAQYWRGDKAWLTLDKTAVGLANVDNTSDLNKPISTATQTALNGKEPTIASGTTTQYWSGDKSWQLLDKAAVGLANVDNTSDANKPVSSATQTALNGKQNLDAGLTSLAGLDATVGLVEQTALDVFTKRAMGVAAATSVLTRADGDGRYITTASGPYLLLTGGTISGSPGSLGIGAAPATALDVVGTIRTTGVTNPATGAGCELVYSGGAGTIQVYDRGASAYQPLTIFASTLTLRGVSGINAVVGGITQATITSTGMTVAPGSLAVNRNLTTSIVNSLGGVLQLQNVDGSNTIIQINAFAANPTLITMASGGTAASPTALSGQLLLSMLGRGYDGTAWSGNQAQIFVQQITSPWTTADHSTRIGFSTTAVGSTAQQTQVLIGPGLTVGVPTAAPAGGMLIGDLNVQRFFVNGLPLTGGGTSVTISDTVPGTSNPGDLWWDSLGTQLYIRYNDGTSAQWVVANTLNIGTPSAPLPVTSGGTGAINFPVPSWTSALGGASMLPLVNGTGAFTVSPWAVGTGLLGLTAYADSSQAAYIEMGRSGNTFASPTASPLNQILGTLSFSGYTGTTWGMNKAYIRANATELWSGTASGTSITMGTTAAGTNTTSVKLTLDGSGNLTTTGAAFFTGNATINATAWPALFLRKGGTGSGCQVMALNGATGSNYRWVMNLGNSDAESTGNAGSNFTLDSYTDAGAYLTSPLQINRATGNVIFSGSIAVNGSRFYIGRDGSNNFWAGGLHKDDSDNWMGVAFNGTGYPTSIQLGTLTGSFVATNIYGAGGGHPLRVQTPTTGDAYIDLITVRNWSIGVQGSTYRSGEFWIYDSTSGRPVIVCDINDNVHFPGSPSGAGILTGAAVTAGSFCYIELGGERSGDGWCFIDMHATTGTDRDFDLRVGREPGVNGIAHLQQQGSGALYIDSGNINTYVYFNTSTSSEGSNAGYRFAERDTSAHWFWYGSGNNARLYREGVADYLRIDNSGNFVVMTNGGHGYQFGGGSWFDLSDVRLKHSIAPYTAGLTEIVRLRPVTYQLNGRAGSTDNGTVHTGFVADEVQAIMPEMVGTLKLKLDPGDTDDTELLTLNTTPLTYAMLNAIKELSARLDAANAQIQALSAKVH